MLVFPVLKVYRGLFLSFKVADTMLISLVRSCNASDLGH
jgi:hypothetical protein